MPVLHFEIHGAEFGLQLGNGDILKCEELAEVCRSINIKLKNGLIVSLATCKGAYIFRCIDIDKPAPYWGFIGPTETIYEDEFPEDFEGFFDILLETNNLGQALDRLNMKYDSFKYTYVPSEVVWDMVLAEIKGHPLESERKRFRRLFPQTRQASPGMNRAARRKTLKYNITKLNQKSLLEKYKNRFLMIG